jgi:predicted membrane metal-binding protein
MLSLKSTGSLKVHWCFIACLLGWIIGPHIPIQEYWFHTIRFLCVGFIFGFCLHASNSSKYAHIVVLFTWCTINSRPLAEKTDRQSYRSEHRVLEWCTPGDVKTFLVRDSNLEMRRMTMKSVANHNSFGDGNFCWTFASLSYDWISKRYEKHYFGFTRAFLFGDMSELKSSVSRAFFELGLIHVLVLSGGHLYFILSFFGFLLNLVPLTLFSMRLLKINGYVRYDSFNKIVLILAMAAFSMATGFSSSMQRALVFAFFAIFPCKRLLAIMNTSKFSAIFLIQCYLFPMEAYDRSFLLSWCGAIILRLSHEPSSSQTFHLSVIKSLKTQLKFGLMSLFAFGQWSLLSFVSNVILLPIFNLLIWCNLFALIWRELTHSEVFFQTQTSLISIFSQWVQEYLSPTNIHLTTIEWLRPFQDQSLCLFTMMLVYLAEKKSQPVLTSSLEKPNSKSCC